MYSRVLLAWRSEHRKWIRNAGAPDYAGIRSRSRGDAARQPVGFFQVKRQPLEPPVARDSEPTRLVILAGVRYMIDHAPPRDAVILRMLLESGARVSEILGLTAKGLRQAHNPKIGIDIFAFVRNKGDHVANKRSKLDSQARTRLDELGDDDPIFLSRRKAQLGYSGFRIVFNRLLRKAQRHFAASTQEPAAIPLALPAITPHTIRHLHTTFRVKQVRELFGNPEERGRALEAVVGDMGWRSSETLKTYDHAMTKAELSEQMGSSIRLMLEDAPHDRASLQALLRGAGQTPGVTPPNASTDAGTLSDRARAKLAWLEEMRES